MKKLEETTFSTSVRVKFDVNNMVIKNTRGQMLGIVLMFSSWHSILF